MDTVKANSSHMLVPYTDRDILSEECPELIWVLKEELSILLLKWKLIAEHHIKNFEDVNKNTM